MNQKLRIFIKVVYYLFTFAIGILIAVILPNYYMYDVSMTHIENSLNEGQYKDAIMIIGGYYNCEYVYQKDNSDGSGIVLFETITIVSAKDNDSKERLQKSYSGFLYNAGGKYNVSGEENNKTKIIVSSLSDIKKNIEILDYDSNDNDVYDNISTLSEKSFIYFVISNELIDSIKSIEFISSDEKIYLEVNNLNLSFNTDFFNEVNIFFDEYNRDPFSEALDNLDKEFRAKNENYLMSSYGNIKQKVSQKTCLIVLIYFICIYIIGDFLVGRHYIIKLFKIIKNKFNKNKEIEEKEVNQNLIGDYYSQVTFKLLVESDCEENFKISYSNENDKIEFYLTKENNYTETKRIHAGVYVNAWLECDEKFEAYDLPKTLTVEGYKKYVEVKIKKVK